MEPELGDSLPPELSVVVPTRNEAGSVPLLLEELRCVLRGLDAEVVFVDDSDDETPQVVAEQASAGSLPLRLLHRLAGQRGDGLGGAVKAGFEIATGTFVVVMDADLQHPPAVIPEMLRRAREARADVVVGTRYRSTGSVGQFGPVRRMVSRASSLLARVAFPRRLASVTDPMSGLFLVRRGSIDVTALQPHGFKILLEILARSGGLRISEVPYQFGQRVADESKASLREGIRFLRHLVRLRFATYAATVRRGSGRSIEGTFRAARLGSTKRAATLRRTA
jgi:dolichol-phosphate mannosyltransferase